MLCPYRHLSDRLRVVATGSLLFVAEGAHGIEARGAARGDVGCEQADGNQAERHANEGDRVAWRDAIEQAGEKSSEP